MRCPSILSTSAAIALRPMAGRGWSTVVKDMWRSAARNVLSKPITETSPGTCSPSSSSLSMSPAATRSFAAKTAVGRSFDSSSSSAAPTPATSV